MSDKKIIEKLLKIASNQQKIIEKLAQAIQPTVVDPLALYLKKGLAQVAGLNMGLNDVNVLEVDKTPEGTYMMHITGVPVPKRQNFVQVMMKQLTTQKPELEGKVGYIFAD